MWRSVSAALFCAAVSIANGQEAAPSSHRAAMEFALAARELRRANEEIKAAAWDEEHSGRSEEVDAAVAQLAHASQNAAQVTREVVERVNAQPKRYAANSAKSSFRSMADSAVNEVHQLRRRTEEATAAVVNAVAQHGRARQHRRATAADTDAVVEAIKQHTSERALQHVTDAAVTAVKQHSKERSTQGLSADATQTGALASATDDAVNAIMQHSREHAAAKASHQEASQAASDSWHAALKQHNRKRELESATDEAVNAITQHAEQRMEDTSSAAAEAMQQSNKMLSEAAEENDPQDQSDGDAVEA